MSREIKFRAWDKKNNVMRENDELVLYMGKAWVENLTFATSKIMIADPDNPLEPLFFTGLKDCEGVEIYHKDICQFDNGDRFVIECEDWIEFFVLWIGEPECEDQARDFYRISKARVIGNTYQNPELLEIAE